MPPEATLMELGLSKSDSIADIGCGIGYFTIPASKITQKTVYGLDTSQEMLDYLAANNSSENIQLIKTDAYDFKIADTAVDFALIANVFHEIADKERFTAEIKRILRTGGRLAVIEFQKKETGMGPDISHRISPGELTDMLGTEFSIEKVVDISGVFYGAVFALTKN